MNCVIKAHLKRADSTVEMRRIPVTLAEQDSTNGVFKEISAKLSIAYPELANKLFTLKWKDSDGDFVVMSTDEEMLEAISHAQKSPLKLFITVDGLKEPEESLGMETDRTPETATADDSTKEKQKDDACDAEWPFMGFMGRPFGRPPPPGFDFGGPMGFISMMGRSRKRGNPDNFNPQGHHGPHSWHHGSRGGHFGHHGPFGPHGPFSHHGPFGHRGPLGQPGPFGRPGPMGQHSGMFGPFGCHGIFEGLTSQPFPAGMRFGHHGKRHGKHGWKANLRDAVPVSHRRWAKAFIRSWRVENLKNATSTSSDSDQDVFDMDASNIPDAYPKWLETLLPKWHKRSGLETSDADKNKEANADDKNTLKASVPVEFRKWTKWYLARHFGKKESPKFRKHAGCHNFGKLNKHEKAWKKGYKMQTLSASIPMMHRMWAKIFIRDWRQEHSIPDPKVSSRSTVTSESEDSQKEAPKGDIVVPNDYVRWMQQFLSRYHLWRGEVEKVEVEKGGMAEFKDTVPKNFCKWVKCYLWQRYGNGVRKEADTASQYQKWLQAFQKKWLREQEKQGGAEEWVITCSDDESASRPANQDEAEKTADSLKKLRLEGDENGAKNVHFHPSTEKMDNEKEPKQHVGIGDFEGALFHKKMNSGFRQWAKEALSQWDGKTAQPAEQAEGANTSERIPPHVYHWMSKVMMKMQMKRMKQEMKQAKEAMKSAKKGQKYAIF